MRVFIYKKNPSNYIVLVNKERIEKKKIPVMRSQIKHKLMQIKITNEEVK